jgi:hypothetical protein
MKPADGGLVLGPRPGKKSKAALSTLGLTHVCTLLHAGENPGPIEGIANELHCRWVWLPISGASLETLSALDTKALVTKLGDALVDEPLQRVYLHCSAGIHRTGFFAAVLLRLQPVEASAIVDALVRLRPVTGQNVGSDRIALAVTRAEALLAE